MAYEGRGQLRHRARAMVIFFLVLAGVLALPACSLFDGGDDDGPAVPEFVDRFPSATLPFAVWDGVEGMRNTYRVQFGEYAAGNRFDPEGFEDEPGLLIGVVAHDDFVGVAFPPGDRGGFDMAWASPDEGWQREPLSDLDPASIADVESAVMADGTVWTAFRPLDGGDIRLVSWRRGESTTEHTFVRPDGPSIVPDHIGRCADLALMVAPDGTTLDLAYRQGDAGGGTRIMHARTADGASTWEVKTVGADTNVRGRLSLPELPAGALDVGCENRLGYDEARFPALLSMVRVFPDGPPGATIPVSSYATRYAGFFVDAQGQWRTRRQMDTLGRLPQFIGPDPGPGTFPAYGIDLERAPGGHLVGGPAILDTTVPGRHERQYVPMPSAVRTYAPGYPSEPSVAVPPKFAHQTYDRYGIKIALDHRGVYASEHPDSWIIRTEGTRAEAPIIMRDTSYGTDPGHARDPSSSHLVGLRSPEYARG
ncbi:MAG: hypothetical protein JRH11_17085, partial [Deltaproteobacteria bacterium]|nr:hypothetical protein [Deltaproteobacteria bacterium]